MVKVVCIYRIISGYTLFSSEEVTPEVWLPYFKHPVDNTSCYI